MRLIRGGWPYKQIFSFLSPFCTHLVVRTRPGYQRGTAPRKLPEHPRFSGGKRLGCAMRAAGLIPQGHDHSGNQCGFVSAGAQSFAEVLYLGNLYRRSCGESAGTSASFNTARPPSTKVRVLCFVIFDGSSLFEFQKTIQATAA